jgi:hypothetical protein
MAPSQKTAEDIQRWRVERVAGLLALTPADIDC